MSAIEPCDGCGEVACGERVVGNQGVGLRIGQQLGNARQIMSRAVGRVEADRVARRIAKARILVLKPLRGRPAAGMPASFAGPKTGGWDPGREFISLPKALHDVGDPSLAAAVTRTRSSGNGMNSLSSPGTVPKRIAFQSCFACSMRSREEATKFQNR